ncbi:DUF302 domain-containing protein [Acidiferrobacter sp.]|jgi:uncharacterized protein (DUF302 family)|uniref:DUF302 domain-containing protein n=1 Tax=Acidiferrobacter sp. TaxID=1872107 RepID=UPI002627E952|nr:DUF302 domain-containing protein [Acidiferrobacter sp.]
MRRFLIGAAFALGTVGTCYAHNPLNAIQGPRIDLNKTIIKVPLAKGVSPKSAVQAMKIEADTVNMKYVGDLPLSKQLKNMGIKSGVLTVYEFCSPPIAHLMVDANPAFAAYLPCRITMVAAGGRVWLEMLNLNMIINGAHLKGKLRTKALRVRDDLDSILWAGARGNW